MCWRLVTTSEPVSTLTASISRGERPLESISDDLLSDHPSLEGLLRSNVLPVQLHAVAGRILHAAGVFPGVRWRQMGIVNTAFGEPGAALAPLFT